MSVGVYPPSWAKLEPLFDRVLELAPQERDALLAELDTTQPDIAQGVRGLLAEWESLDAAGFMRVPLSANMQHLAVNLVKQVLAENAESSAATTLPEVLGLKAGAVIGPYRLLQEIGRGGQSYVWLAERSDGQLKREVALKLSLAGLLMHTERFLQERDILAALTHANIARLYDAGISDSGQPYLAMEYVAGTALIKHCDEQRLTIRERLRLFLQVLEAAQFAHAALIIHRDLKPSNILVTAEGRVVLLDFGIGKLLTDDIAQATQFTQLFGRALTPDYASPEQVSDKPLGIASDIYSLGIILYELLTGARPYRPKHNSRAALEEAILREDLRRPSHSDISATAASARGSSVRVLSRTLLGDLDAIVLTALKKNPQDRYASVTAFAQDIANHLHNLPVSTRPDSNWYRVERFVTRHKLPVTVVSIASLALLSTTTIAVWQARAAAAERGRAMVFASRNEAVTEFLGTIMREAAESSKPVTVSAMLARSEKLAVQDTSDIPENRAAVLEMIGEQYFATGDSRRAARLQQRAVSLLAHSSDHALRSRMVCGLALVQSELGQSANSVAAITNELRSLDSDPETASSCLMNLAEISWASRTPEEALHYAKEGLQRYESVPRTTGDFGAQLIEAVAYSYHLNGRNAEANQYFERALRKYQQSGHERRPPAVTMMGTWASVINRAGNPKQALHLYDEILRIEAQREPDAEPARTVVTNRGRTLAALGRFAEARMAFDQACRRAEQQEDLAGRLQCMLDLGSLAVQNHALIEAAEYLKRADELLDPNLSPASPPILARTVLEARIYVATNRLDEARALFDRVLATKLINHMILSAELGKAEIDLARDNGAVAVQQAQLGLQIATTMQSGLPYSNQTGLAQLMLGRAWLQLGNHKQARQAIEAAITQLSNTVDADHPELQRARQLLGSI